MKNVITLLPVNSDIFPFVTCPAAIKIVSRHRVINIYIYMLLKYTVRTPCALRVAENRPWFYRALSRLQPFSSVSFPRPGEHHRGYKTAILIISMRFNVNIYGVARHYIIPKNGPALHPEES